MRQTVVGVFERYESARHAANLLQDSGFGPDAVHLTDRAAEGGDASTLPEEHHGAWDSIRSFFAEVFGSDRDSREHVSEYAEAVRRGCAVVKVDVDDEPQVEQARQVLESAGAMNIDERVAEWREQGWSGEVDADEFERVRDDGALGTHAAAGSTSVPSDAGSIGMPVSAEPGTMRSATRDAGREDVIPVVKEQLEVGKRAVSTGGVRVYAHAVERPVQEKLDLREEHAHVERRPVDRPASQADLDAMKDRTIEVRETAETPVVKKSARVVEEVVVGKDETRRTETVSDTVRDTEVKVDQLARDAGRMLTGDRDLDAMERDWREDWQRNYAALGGSYEDWDPAYRWGHTLRSDARWQGRDWDAIEPELRGEWEHSHPGSAWERFKAAVRRGWERIT